MIAIEERVGESVELEDCPECSERIAQCACDDNPWVEPFRFCQLGDREQEKAIEQQREWNNEDFDPIDCLHLEVVKQLGFELNTRRVNLRGGRTGDELDIGYSVGSPGEYVTFSGTWAAERFSLHELQQHTSCETALALGLRMSVLFMQYPTAEAKITVTGRYDGTMHGEFYPVGSDAWGVDDACDGHEEDETITELARDTADMLLDQMRDEYQSCYDRDRCIEDIEANEQRFDCDGNSL